MSTSSQEVLAALRNKQNFSVATGNLSFSISVSSHQIMTLTNPTGSMSNMYIYSMIYYTSNSTPSSVNVFANPTTTISGTAAANVPLFVDGTTPSGDLMELKASTGTTAMAGSMSSMFPGPDGNSTELLNSPFIIAPGQTVGFDIAYTAAVGVTVRSYVMFYYYREPIQ